MTTSTVYSGDESELDQPDLLIQTGVRQRRTRPASTRRNIKSERQQQPQLIIGGDVVRSMKRGLSARRSERRTRALLYIAIGMFAILSLYWLYRLNRRLGLVKRMFRS